MENLETLLKVSQAVTDQPVKIEVDIDPKNIIHKFFQQKGWKPKKKVLEILPTRMGSLLKISGLVVTIGEEKIREILSEENHLQNVFFVHKLIAEHGETLIKIIAQSIHNKPGEPPASIEKLIREQFTPKSILEVLVMVLKMMDTRNFILSIVSIRGLNILETNPKTQGSQIAPGTSSED